MLGKVIIENGVKKIQALTADTGTGAPVGSYLYLEKKSDPIGYLYCDGSTFDETVYPALYAYLGTNVLPDWREFSAVGAEQNTTSSVIATHDVFTQGQEKDDQLQSHVHRVDSYENGSTQFSTKVLYKTDTGLGSQNVTDTGLTFSARIGTVTRGKSKAVFIYIKATSGVMESNTENFINVMNAERSYSTSEVNTGKKWIDGKLVYRKVVEYTLPQSSGGSYDSAGAFSLTGIDNIITAIAFNNYDNGAKASTDVAFENGNILIEKSYTGTSCSGYAIVEYTKTTD